VRHNIQSLLLILVLVTATQAGEDREIHGRVVDEAGKPMADADVDYYWRANGSVRTKDGRVPDFSKDEDVKALWGSLGEMEPFGSAAPRQGGPQAVKTGPDGRFSIKMPRFYLAVMAMDRTRKRGGLVVTPKGDEGSPVEIRLVPLVKVRGSFAGPGAGVKPPWTHVYTLLPEDPTRPLNSTRLVSCGSFEARFEMSLPPGRYFLEAYDDPPVGRLDPNKEILLSAVTPEVDLGVLPFSRVRSPYLTTRIEQSKARGSWGDYTQHYGQKPPRWHVTDARGVSKDVQLSDFKGKWVLLDFWGLSCRPCLATGLPKLMRFYEEHKAQHDRFEILSICIDMDGDLKSLADVDKALEPIIKHVWGGKPLPFPVMLDPTFKTWERFGLTGLGEVLLIDPDGNLVKGDETVLAEKLK
jgi:hypothetical protein